MAHVLISAENESDLKKIIEFAKKFRAKTKKVNMEDMEDMEDMELLKAMEDGKQKDYVSENDILATIEQQKKIVADEC